MREIKFRAWDKDRMVMLSGDDIESTINPNGSHEYYSGLSYGVLFVSYFHYTGDWRECDVMQFTGLLDKNGNEVYEGDILAIPHFMDIKGWRYLHHAVEWSDRLNGWFCRNVLSDHENDGNLQLFVYAKKPFEVVGNVHENPELLEVT